MSMQKTAVCLVVMVLVLAIGWLGWGSPWLGEPTPVAAGEPAALATGRVDAANVPAPNEPPAPLAPAAAVAREVAAAALVGALVVRVVFADGAPVADAVVELYRSGTADLDAPRVRSEADGYARFAALPPGKLTPTVHRGNRQWGKAVTIVAGAAVQSELQLEPGMNVRGIVVDGRQQPIVAAEVVACDWGGGEAFLLARTAADGTFALRAVHTHCHIGARAPGYAASSLRQFTASKEANVELRIVLDAPAVAIRGTVLDPQQQPVVGAVVRAGDEEQRGHDLPDGGRAHGWRPEYAHTDADGRFALHHVPAGTVPLAVRARGFAPWLGELQLVAGQPQTTTVRLLPGAAVQGTVRNAAGDVVAGAEITLGEQHELVRQRMRSGADGTFRIEGLPAGAVPAVATSEAHGKARAQLTLQAGQELVWQPVLSKGAQQRGRVVDADGKPVAKVMVEAQGHGAVDGDWFFAHEHTDAEGRFTLQDVPAGVELTLQIRRKSTFPELVQTVPQRTDAELLLQLPKEAWVHIRGTVLGPDGKPVPNVSVSPFLTTGSSSPAETADAATGAFALGPYPAGDYTLRLEAADLVPVQLQRKLTGDETWDLGEVRLQRGAYVVLAPVAADAELLAGVRFEAAGTEGGARHRFENRTGRWRAGPLREGSYRLFAAGERVAAMSWPFELRAGAELTVDVPLQRGTAATFVAIAPAAPAPGTILEFGITDAQGALLDRPAAYCKGIEAQLQFGLLPGRYTITATGGGLRGTGSCEVVAGAAAPVVRIEMRRE